MPRTKQAGFLVPVSADAFVLVPVPRIRDIDDGAEAVLERGGPG
jgi:hypothetical protein